MLNGDYDLEVCFICTGSAGNQHSKVVVGSALSQTRAQWLKETEGWTQEELEELGANGPGWWLLPSIIGGGGQIRHIGNKRYPVHLQKVMADWAGIQSRRAKIRSLELSGLEDPSEHAEELSALSREYDNLRDRYQAIKAATQVADGEVDSVLTVFKCPSCSLDIPVKELGQETLEGLERLTTDFEPVSTTVNSNKLTVKTWECPVAILQYRRK